VLDLADMQASPDLDAELADAFNGLQRALGGSRWCVEDHKEAIASGVDLSALVTPHGGTEKPVVVLDEVAPAPIAEFGGHFRGADDIGEENCC
jgi:hypothetical protein